MRKIFLGLAFSVFLVIAWAVYAADMGQRNVVFTFVRSLPFGDKIGHFCLFGTLCFFATLGTNFHRFTLQQIHIPSATSIILSLALLEEITQAWSPYRTFDLMDLLADFLGAGTATFLAYALQRRRQAQSQSSPESKR